MIKLKSIATYEQNETDISVDGQIDIKKLFEKKKRS